jgi:hypothetical protein
VPVPNCSHASVKIPRQKLGDLLGHRPRTLHRTTPGALRKRSQVRVARMTCFLTCSGPINPACMKIWRRHANLGRYLPPLSMFQVLQKIYPLLLRNLPTLFHRVRIRAVSDEKERRPGACGNTLEEPCGARSWRSRRTAGRGDTWS